MTGNIVSYRRYQEDVRHNREMERLTGEAQEEAKRHNVAVEDENRRTNIANETIKREQNVITATHYGKSDFETARHDAMVEYYSYELPEAYGYNKSHAQLEGEKAGEAHANTVLLLEKADTESQSRGPNIQHTDADTNYKNALTGNVYADTAYKDAQTKKVLTEVWYMPQEKEANLKLTKAQTFETYTRAASDIGRTIKDTIWSGFQTFLKSKEVKQNEKKRK